MLRICYDLQQMIAFMQRLEDSYLCIDIVHCKFTADCY